MDRIDEFEVKPVTGFVHDPQADERRAGRRVDEFSIKCVFKGPFQSDGCQLKGASGVIRNLEASRVAVSTAAVQFGNFGHINTGIS